MKNELINLIKIYQKIRSENEFKTNDELDKNFEKIKYSIIKTIGNKFDTVKVEYSYGSGSWAIIPWIAILDTNKTSTVSKGTYIVFLFSAKKKSVFLTLNQGTGGINMATTGQEHIDTAELYKN